MWAAWQLFHRCQGNPNARKSTRDNNFQPQVVACTVRRVALRRVASCRRHRWTSWQDFYIPDPIPILRFKMYGEVKLRRIKQKQLSAELSTRIYCPQCPFQTWQSSQRNNNYRVCSSRGGLFRWTLPVRCNADCPSETDFVYLADCTCNIYVNIHLYFQLYLSISFGGTTSNG